VLFGISAYSYRNYLTGLECETLEYAIDDAFNSGYYEQADILYGIYENGGCMN